MNENDIDAAAQYQAAYKLTFGSQSGQTVLRDLTSFCRGTETCVVAEKGQPIDVHRSLILEGRREVFLRIQRAMNLTPEQLIALVTGQRLRLGETDG